ncbi:YdcF family protein [Shewanella khirikhana]|uniref:DUF218 domain-containing protein n=1 Tax=Shewanella khirikhana TaxID=1965282 RepID=A0ABM7DNR3_9GAMM|nr:YdcF family protein [Shewanella khirikhana]AZQ11068.1 hypothetical protein STH12_01980 [Shewanella khirikhana]
MFWLKKILSLLIMPIPALVLLLLLALWLWRRRVLAKSLVTSALITLVFLSSSFGSRLLVSPLESRFSATSQPISGPCVVAVLGSGHEDDIHGSAVQQLSTIALARLSEGVRQLSLGQECTLVVSGFSGGLNTRPHAEVMRAAAIELGVDESRIIVLPQPRDTLEEARQIKALGIDKVRLVTSAAHMARAMAMFAHEGVIAEAAPTDFTARRSYWWRLSARELYNSQMAIHEYVGMLWFSLRY